MIPGLGTRSHMLHSAAKMLKKKKKRKKERKRAKERRYEFSICCFVLVANVYQAKCTKPGEREVCLWISCLKKASLTDTLPMDSARSSSCNHRCCFGCWISTNNCHHISCLPTGLFMGDKSLGLLLAETLCLSYPLSSSPDKL